MQLQDVLCVGYGVSRCGIGRVVLSTIFVLIAAREWTVMNMRLIDADEVQKRIDMMGTVNGILCCDAHEFIDNVPTIEFEPFRRGGWIFHMQATGYLWKCSECGGNSENRYAFCPFCGALMWGGGD